MQDVKTLTLYEYEARMYAFRLQQVDKQHDMHLQAWIHNQAKATKKNGKPAYSKFTDFFDYEKEIKRIDIETKGASSLTGKQKKLAQIAKRLNERR